MTLTLPVEWPTWAFLGALALFAAVMWTFRG